MKIKATIIGNSATCPHEFVSLDVEQAPIDGLNFSLPFVNDRLTAFNLIQDMQASIKVLERFILKDLPLQDVPNRGVDSAFAPILNGICPLTRFQRTAPTEVYKEMSEAFRAAADEFM